MDKHIRLEVKPELVDIEAARRDADDLAWEHAKVAALAGALPLGSDPHEFLYKEMQKRYAELTNYLEFLTFNGLVLIRAMLNSGHVKLAAEKPIHENDVAQILGELSQMAVSSYAWMIAGYEILWPANKTMPDVGVAFNFPLEDITRTEETE